MSCLDSPTSSLNPAIKPFNDSILDYIFNEKVYGLMVETETIGLLLVVFWGAEGPPKTLEGNIFAEEAEWAMMVEPGNQITKDMLFEKPTMEMTKHLKPLYIKAHINGKPFNKVFVNGRVVLNIMPLATMVRLGKNFENPIPTNMKITSFIGHASHALGVLIAYVAVGSKVTRFVFFVIEGKPSYVVIFGKY